MFDASVGVTPATRVNRGTDAVLTSTPTPLTASSTTASSVRASCVWLTSCWYCPTPIDFGSILTSSANGSCRRRAIDTAPRSETSMDGNSAAASSDAEYTDAPDSLTTTHVGLLWAALEISRANFSDSRDAVPLPMAINSTLWALARAVSSSTACFQRFWGWCG